MGNKSTICYECGGTVLATDQNINYEPVVRLVKGKAETLHRHKDCSKGDVIGPDDRAKAKVMVVGGGGDGSEQEGLDLDDEEDQEFFDENLEEEEEDLGYDEELEENNNLRKQKQQQELENLIEKAKEQAQKEHQQRMEDIVRRLKGHKMEFPKLSPKTKEDEGSIRLSREEREALAAALYIADVVEITGEKLVNPRRFNAEMKKVLYKVIKDL